MRRHPRSRPDENWPPSFCGSRSSMGHSTRHHGRARQRCPMVIKTADHRRFPSRPFQALGFSAASALRSTIYQGKSSEYVLVGSRSGRHVLWGRTDLPSVNDTCPRGPIAGLWTRCSASISSPSLAPWVASTGPTIPWSTLLSIGHRMRPPSLVLAKREPAPVAVRAMRRISRCLIAESLCPEPRSDAARMRPLPPQGRVRRPARY